MISNHRELKNQQDHCLLALLELLYSRCKRPCISSARLDSACEDVAEQSNVNIGVIAEKDEYVPTVLSKYSGQTEATA
ncbi:hypothetical protein GOP56_15095 [Brevibacillus sp. 7WMA2]|uniref:hypothetical protein n=1 Tax=Brevibacillus TaxID=55080 RepID=UPI0013A7AC37|nr:MULTISPECIES: hypothetical protein [Brevibacillus]MCR8996004.1 hypothetical protein [Brevibacillus laterosporus]QIC06814.1 hypothetical protein GOP56_15095 [Brevibacillus sp. 7WMA2]